MRKTLAFAIVTSDTGRRARLSQVCDDLGTRLGALVYPQIARTYAELAEGIAGGKVDIAWTPPLIAADLAERGVASVAVVSRRDNSAHYRSVIFARNDSPITTTSDLAGRHIAWVDEASASGYIVPRVWLRDNSFSPDTLFGRQSFLGTHGRVAEAVLKRTVDVGATFALFSAGLRATVEAGWTELSPSSADEIRVIVNAGVVPADCISVAARIDPDLKTKIEGAFLKLPSATATAYRAALGAESYERATPAHKSSLQRLQREAARSSVRRLPDV